uniref:Uncharacterized protein n=1 Tax=Strigops habroptila TaxID=2489341 RepID=A0A672U0F8_STRHB
FSPRSTPSGSCRLPAPGSCGSPVPGLSLAREHSLRSALRAEPSRRLPGGPAGRCAGVEPPALRGPPGQTEAGAQGGLWEPDQPPAGMGAGALAIRVSRGWADGPGRRRCCQGISPSDSSPTETGWKPVAE